METATQWLCPQQIELDVDVPGRREALRAVSVSIARAHGDSAHRRSIARCGAGKWQASTAVGNGLAIPHARITGIAEPVTMYMRTRALLNFAAPDGKRVSELYVILVPAEGALPSTCRCWRWWRKPFRIAISALVWPRHRIPRRSGLCFRSGSPNASRAHLGGSCRRRPMGSVTRDRPADVRTLVSRVKRCYRPGARAAWLSRTSRCISATRCGATLPASTACHTAQPGSRSWRQSRNRQWSEQRADLDERFRDRLGRDMREAEHLEPRRVDDPAAAVALGQRVERGLRRRVPAGGKRFRDRRRLRLHVRRDGVQDRRLAHARLADEDGALDRASSGRSGEVSRCAESGTTRVAQARQTA